MHRTVKFCKCGHKIGGVNATLGLQEDVVTVSFIDTCVIMWKLESVVLTYTTVSHPTFWTQIVQYIHSYELFMRAGDPLGQICVCDNSISMFHSRNYLRTFPICYVSSFNPLHRRLNCNPTLGMAQARVFRNLHYRDVFPFHAQPSGQPVLTRQAKPRRERSKIPS